VIVPRAHPALIARAQESEEEKWKNGKREGRCSLNLPLSGRGGRGRERLFIHTLDEGSTCQKSDLALSALDAKEARGGRISLSIIDGSGKKKGRDPRQTYTMQKYGERKKKKGRGEKR